MRSKLLLCMPLLFAPLRGQHDGTTLSQLLDSSDAVVVARVHRTAATDPSTTARQLVSLETLSGSPPATFTLSEPTGHACGQALRGLLVGQRVIVFLRQSGGQWRLRATTHRSIPLASGSMVDHVRALSRTTDPAGRARLAVQALDHAHSRVRDDAALDLPNLQGLNQLDAQLRGAITTHLDRQLTARGATLPALATACGRLQDRHALSLMLPSYLQSSEDVAMAGLLRRAVTCFDHTVVSSMIQAHLGGPSGQQLETQRLALSLLESLDTPAATLPALWQILDRTHHTDIAIASARQLLDRGADPATVRQRSHPQIVERANQRRHRIRRFRSVLQQDASAQGGQTR